LYVKVMWAPEVERHPSFSSSLVLRLDSIDIPKDEGIRDLSRDPWDGNMIFKPEEYIMVYGYQFQLNMIEDFMFPGFHPTKERNFNTCLDGSGGSGVTEFRGYQVKYTIRVFGDYNTASIDEILVPIRSIMTFTNPRVVTTHRQLETTRCSSLFNTEADERRFKSDHRRPDLTTRAKALCRICSSVVVETRFGNDHCFKCCLLKDGICLKHVGESFRNIRVNHRRHDGRFVEVEEEYEYSAVSIDGNTLRDKDEEDWELAWLRELAAEYLFSPDDVFGGSETEVQVSDEDDP